MNVFHPKDLQGKEIIIINVIHILMKQLGYT